MKFDRADRLSFAATTMLAFLVYYGTLAPEVGLENSGYFSVAAYYGGVSMPAGFPIWTAWAWVFTKCVPGVNVEQRVALAAATAAALACGVIALMVSQMGATILERQRNGGPVPKEEMWVRATGGYAAGMVFGLNGGFWPWAVVADPFAFNILLLSLVLWLLWRWSCQPASRIWLYGAALAYGALLSDSQIELMLAPAIPFVVVAHDREVGRDMLLTASALFLGGVVWRLLGGFALLSNAGAWTVFFALGEMVCLTATFLMVKTRRAFSNWRVVLGCVGGAALGLSACLWPVLASMANPPSNWAYPRTAEGFLHMITRGQYDRIYMVDSISRAVEGLGVLISLAARDFGWPYLVVAVVPLVLLRKFGVFERKTVLSLAMVYSFLAFLTLAVLSPGRERQSAEFVKMYFSPSYIPLAVLMGCGLVIMGGRVMGRARIPQGSDESALPKY